MTIRFLADNTDNQCGGEATKCRSFRPSLSFIQPIIG
jgi:hypothetical protein